MIKPPWPLLAAVFFIAGLRLLKAGEDPEGSLLLPQSAPAPGKASRNGAPPSGKEPVRLGVRAETKDHGDFLIVYVPPGNPEYLKLERVMREKKTFEQLVAGLNKKLALPFDVPIEFSECGLANAVYDPEAHRITMCYELIEDSARTFPPALATSEALSTAILSAAFFTVYHELGHALIDIYKIPAVGKEEDAVDQLATLSLIWWDEEGEEGALIASAEFYFSGLRRREPGFWDEHALDQQRFYDIMCLVYGRDPRKHASLLADGSLPRERAARCEREYRRVNAAWRTLLRPYLKTKT